jgi:hypothetical protein
MIDINIFNINCFLVLFLNITNGIILISKIRRRKRRVIYEFTKKDLQYNINL